jgi:hypothetical protein
MKRMIPWFGVAIILVIIFGTIYGAVQQAQRDDADYPQIQIAEDAALKLDQNAIPASLVQGTVDMNTQLDPFTLIYSRSGKVVAGSGYLNGTLPTVPVGILTDSNGAAYYRVTWQPQSDIRIAAVVVKANNYYVLSGRSLKVVETDENQTFHIATLGGILSLVVLISCFVLMKPLED